MEMVEVREESVESKFRLISSLRMEIHSSSK
jgi:hypothetical protein